MMLQVRINATGGTDVYRQVAAFAYGAWLGNGCGAVCIREQAFGVGAQGPVTAHVTYVPCTALAAIDFGFARQSGCGFHQRFHDKNRR
jgi:hypothetical protein